MRQLLLMLLFACATSVQAGDSTVVKIFDHDSIAFRQVPPPQSSSASVQSLDNGRVIITSVDLPKISRPTTITAHVLIEPIPKDELEVYDRWDRAGAVRLSVEGMPDIELTKFITSYGGRTGWDVDISYLAPLLQGRRTLQGFVDTWVSPAWKMSLSLTYSPVDTGPMSTWAQGLFSMQSATRDIMGDTGLSVSVTVPTGLHRVLLYYCVSGHCTDGRDADEFVQKDNVISIDHTVVHRFRPWRDDCRQFRTINPYTRRWSDGTWSSDYSRSGWCPGDWVKPLVLDVTDHLTPGAHTVNVRIENIRPKDKDGNYGYWRISGLVVGYPAPADTTR